MQKRTSSIPREEDRPDPIELQTVNGEVESLPEYYRREVVEKFDEYFQRRGLDISDYEFKKVPTSLYHDAFAYVYERLFKPPRGSRTKTLNRPTYTTLDVEDAVSLVAVVEAYAEIVRKYSIVSRYYMFCDMIGITRFCFNTWENGTARSRVYFDSEGKLIENISIYKLQGWPYREEESLEYRRIANAVRNIAKESLQNKLADTPTGVYMTANFDYDSGLQYELRGYIQKQAVDGLALSARELPRLGEKG